MFVESDILYLGPYRFDGVFDLLHFITFGSKGFGRIELGENVIVVERSLIIQRIGWRINMKNGETVIRVLYDHRILGQSLLPDWGVSIYIGTDKNNILFDTGFDKDILLNNMETLKVKKEKIDTIVISHRHWDHFGGLAAFEGEKIRIFVIKSLVERIKKEFNLAGEIIPITDFTEIAEGVYSTGEIGSVVKEQSLIVKGKDGVYILTGCGHPGLKKIMEIASEVGEVKGIIGGYHGFDSIELLENIPLLVPCHCTMLLDKINDRYPKAYNECGVGYSIKI